MNKITYVFLFLYRIRYWIIIPPVLVTFLVAYFTNNMSKNYEASTTIFTGITSSPSLDGISANILTTNNSFDNIINLVKSRSILEQVSLKLFAEGLMYGESDKDNNYIKAENYKNLLSIVPDDVKKLIDKKSLDNTYNNLVNYKRETGENFVFGLLNWEHQHYSISSLSKIQVRRLGASDMIEIKYTSDDPGIVHNTLLILNEVISREFSDLQLKSSNDVINFFEKQLIDIKESLIHAEDSLLKFTLDAKIVNYEEQTKIMTTSRRDQNDKYEQSLTDFYTSAHLIERLEKQLDERVGLLKENKKFLQTLETVSSLAKKISELETFSDESSGSRISIIPRYKEMLKKSEAELQSITTSISSKKLTKEGLTLDQIVIEWLAQLIINEKAKAQIEVYKERKATMDDEFAQFSPIGPNLRRIEREIVVLENSYQNTLHNLAQARLKQKDIEMKSTTLKIVSKPIYPLSAVGSKRKIMVAVAYIGSLIFIIGFFLIIELLDKTLRDKHRAEYLTKSKILGAFPGKPKLKHRGYILETNRRATTYICNRILQYINPNGTTVINVFSNERGEGKTHVIENLMEYLIESGFVVKYLNYEVDFDVKTKDYLLAGSYEDLTNDKSSYDIVIVEYQALKLSAIPNGLLNTATLNILIADATRAWRDIDQIILDQIKERSKNITLPVILNNAKRIAVEDFTGQLPPYTKLRNFVHKILQQGLTAEKVNYAELDSK